MALTPAALRPIARNLGLVEANRHAIAGGDEEVRPFPSVTTGRQQLVVLRNLDPMMPVAR